MDRVLIVAAHPDDDILGCGGFLAKYANQKSIRVIFIAEGTSCRFKRDEIGEKDVLKEIKNRNKNAISALKCLNIDNMEFYNLPCGRLDAVPIIDINKIIEHEIGNFNPNTILTHSEHDINNDHRILFRSVMMATRPGVFKDLKNVMSFEIPSSSEWNFSNSFLPNSYEILDESHVKKKWDALSCFKSEIRPYPHPRSKEGVWVLAKYRGMQIGYSLAEAYRTIRSITT